jgi:hypothetical protein
VNCLISGDAWTSVCSFRITLYRRRLTADFCERTQDVRFAYFQKCEGIVVKDEEAKNVPFLITVRTLSSSPDVRTWELRTLCFQRIQIQENMVYQRKAF